MHEQRHESLARARHGAGRRTRPRRAVRPAAQLSSDASERLCAQLRQRLIAFYLMPSDADGWIEKWRTTKATGDPCSGEYWDRGFRWIVTAVQPHTPQHAAPSGDVDPALAAVITRGFGA